MRHLANGARPCTLLRLLWSPPALGHAPAKPASSALFHLHGSSVPWSILVERCRRHPHSSGLLSTKQKLWLKCILGVKGCHKNCQHLQVQTMLRFIFHDLKTKQRLLQDLRISSANLQKMASHSAAEGFLARPAVASARLRQGGCPYHQAADARLQLDSAL